MSLLELTGNENLDCETIPVSYGRDNRALQNSIAAVGVLQPLLLRRAETGGLQLISGTRRWQAARQSGQSHIPALQLEVSLAQAFKMHLHANQTRGFNAVEAARALTRAAQLLGFSPSQSAREIMPLLGRPPLERQVQEYQRLLELPPVALAALAQERLSYQAALDLLAFDATAIEALVTLITKFKFGLNKQREIIAMLWELAQREGQGVVELLQRPLVAVAQSSGAAFRRCLKALKYPQLTQHEQEFQQLVHKLSLPHNIQLQPYPYFEKPEATLTLRFKTHLELAQSIRTLQQLLEQPELLRRLCELL